MSYIGNYDNTLKNNIFKLINPQVFNILKINWEKKTT